jgi:subtilase family serine protease
MKLARLSAAALAASLLSACGGGGSVLSTAPPAAGGAGTESASMAVTTLNFKRACDAPQPGDNVTCYALVRTDIGGAPGSPTYQAAQQATPASAPSGYGPTQLRAAYDLPSTTGGTGQTVALVESGDYPTAEADLATYRSEYGLPACGSGCFSKVGQTGTSKLPAENADWAEETALDEDMVSAICPNCHILIVEADSSTFANLSKAVDTAAKLGATEISNSYGGSEFASSSTAYSHTGIVITASAGDDGYEEGSTQPCSFASVVCTGGTSLQPATSKRAYTEVVWNDLSIGHGASGSGCSSLVAKPTWQNDKGCTMRTQSDVSFDSDPEYGVAVYDSTPYEGYEGWLVFGGTSVASPAISSVYALAGNASSLGPTAASRIWGDKGTGLYHVTKGNNLASGESCASAYPYVCKAGTDDDGVYSGPGGWGTPHSVTDF